MKMGTCADCGQPMYRGTTSLPQGEARCRACRAANPRPRRERSDPQLPPPHKAIVCAACGGPAWKGSSSRPGEAVCLDCYRRRNDGQHDGRHCPCIDCGEPSWGERCLTCRAKFQTVRSDDDYRVVRSQREHAAPGLNSYRRSLLLAKWKRQGRQCAYCPALADTVDHVIPLVRGGTNYEGNLAPCCRRCNGSKAARTVAEWRSSKPAPRMPAPLAWDRKVKLVRSIKSIKGESIALFSVCACGAAYSGRARYCSARCRARSTYRMKVGIPLGAEDQRLRSSGMGEARASA